MASANGNAAGSAGPGGPLGPSGSPNLQGASDRPGTIMQGDRRKAYRPISEELRRSAFEAGLEAYARGDFFEAHELLEPAWMGTSNVAERSLYQGIIKLAAGYVHAVRGNPIGMARNLEGARRYLTTSEQLDPGCATSAGIDLAALVAAVDDRLAAVRALPAIVGTNPAALLDLAADAPPVR